VIAISPIAALQVLVSYVSFRSRRVRKVLEGHPIVVIQDGKLLEQNLRRQRMTPDELAEEMRIQQIAKFADARWGILESNGFVSFGEK
jgi:uncharacterized membrane protein YcaP (DUF421 family)